MDLVRDVLDKQIFDRQGRKVSKVDGIVIVLRRGRPPRVEAVEIGAIAAWRRVHPALGRWWSWLERKLGVGDGEPPRIRFEHVRKEGIDVKLNIDAERTGAYVWENWLKRNFISRIPGSGA